MREKILLNFLEKEFFQGKGMPLKRHSKRIVQKTAEATGHLVRSKIADKIASIGKSKEKEKPKEIEEIYIPPEKRQQIVYDLRLF